MWFAYKAQRFLFFILILCTQIHWHFTHKISSNVELIPTSVVLNSTSNIDFLCINHQSDGSLLNISLSKNISDSQLNISVNQLNTTTVHIRLQLRNYVGIFHLLCFPSNKQNEGTRAEVIVKATSGRIQLVERCQVYDRQYIKCIIRAPTLARAIQNNFLAEFQFTEITRLSDKPSYNTAFEFLKNESTEEYLVFKWKPTIDGEFPDGVIMNMKASLPYFDVSYYRFPMTPRFVIKPNFVLQKLSKNSIQIQLTPIFPPALCEKSITSKTSSIVNQTWTMIKSDNNYTIINNILPNTTYRICMRCRQVDKDLYGVEECREIGAPNSPPIDMFSIYVVIIFYCIVLLILGFVYLISRNRQPVLKELSVPSDIDETDDPVNDSDEIDDPVNDNNEETYLPVAISDDAIETVCPSQTQYVSLY